MEHLMTSEEIAELLHIDPVTVRRLVNKGELSAYRIGADYRFAPSDLQHYLQRQRISAHSQDASSTNLNNPLEQFTQLLRKVLQGKHITPTELVDYFDRSTKFDRFTKRARHVLTLAQQEAQRFQHNYIGTEHLLLGLIREGEGIAADVLKSLGLQLEQVRTETLRALRQHQQEQEEAPAPVIPPVPSEATALLAEEEPGLTCTSCGARCPGYFRYCFNCGQPMIGEESSHSEEE